MYSRGMIAYAYAGEVSLAGKRGTALPSGLNRGRQDGDVTGMRWRQERWRWAVVTAVIGEAQGYALG
uniref:Uncharacterized protein n=1 Tax=Oryza meridionalis TaxID=40149 RepID=A0A0E0EQM0_9ORYZ